MAATDGASALPDEGEKVDFHYTCFVKSDGRLWELDGDLEGPVDLGALDEDEDVVSEVALKRVWKFIELNYCESVGVSMLALVNDTEA